LDGGCRFVTVAIAIVGAGPSGFFAADALLRKRPDARLDLIDRLPTPYGLVRGGVAPDHQGTKAIMRQFERILMNRACVRFLGNVELGCDVALAELRGFYDAVIIATGAPADRRLGIPGEGLAGVYGSGAFVGWYNGHPDGTDLAPLLDGPDIAVIGNGNVAIDVVRVLAKTPEEMAAGDLCGHAARAISAAPLRRLHLIGRRRPANGSFTSAELAELGTLARARPVVVAADIPPKDVPLPDNAPKFARKNLEILRGFIGAGVGKPVEIRFHFQARPVAILGRHRVEAIRMERALSTGEVDTLDLPVSTVITAIGYLCTPIPGLELDERRGVVANDEGRIASGLYPGLYVVGWAKRGPSGTIPTNRADSAAVADLLLADLGAAVSTKPGSAGLDRLLANRSSRVVSFDDWQRINAAETARAAPGHPREKFVRIADMMGTLAPPP
jgi:ferredoxin--NADP+ reductase